MIEAIAQHAHTFVVDVARLALWLLILGVIFVPLERLFALHRQPVFRRAIAIDIGYYFLGGLLPALVLAPPLSVVAWGAHTLLPASVTGLVAGWPIAVRMAVALVVGEVGFYWGHRWAHDIPLIWRFHAVHHGAEQLDFLVASRAHPVDLVFVRMCGLVPLYALGLAAPGAGSGSVVPLLVVLVGTMWGYFIHANLRWRLGPLEWLVSTPAFHHWHHTSTAPLDRNFASMLPWIDRLFGTHHLPRQWPATYGTDVPMAPTLVGQLLQPLHAPPAATARPERATAA